MDIPTVTDIEAYAEKLVGRYKSDVLHSIICGDYPALFAAFSNKRIGVYERASLIVLDVREGRRPESIDVWTKEAIEKRIAALKADVIQVLKKPGTVVDYRAARTVDDVQRRREIASGVKLDSSWSTPPIRTQGLGPR